MIGLLTAFFTSLITTLLIIRFKSRHAHFSSDSDFSGPQRFHTEITPRIGGISIAVGLTLAILLKLNNLQSTGTEIMLLISAIPTFFIGLAEDFTKKISIRKRFFFTIISSILLIFLLEIKIISLDVPPLDILFSIPFLSVLLSIFAITGLVNAYNIIDGFHGLSSMIGVITLLAITYIAFLFSDIVIMYLSLVMVTAIIGFFIANYPRGLIFLGDGGAYLIGFWVAALSIMLIFKHPEVSPWFALLVNAYPVTETCFTIYRRKIRQGKNPTKPDGIHFHTLIYRRVLKNHTAEKNLLSSNAKTAPYLWVFAGLSIAIAVIWWQSTIILSIGFLGFLSLYIWLYNRIVKFCTPKWLHPKYYYY